MKTCDCCGREHSSWYRKCPYCKWHRGYGSNFKTHRGFHDRELWVELENGGFWKRATPLPIQHERNH